MLLGVAGMIESAAARIEALTAERYEAWKERAAALAQLALARPIAEAGAAVCWFDVGAQCPCCGETVTHAADCPVPAWIAATPKRYKSNGCAVPPGIKVCSAQQRRRTPPAFAEWLVELAASTGRKAE